ncbi:hypothetical protein EDB89DRAFT_2228874 [Lactarius sanguifluus]|nr:hypothetical protein EDB89DRAFT_2228874 [Lactarius sanguifluus]
MYDDDDDPFTVASHTDYGDECLMDDLQANVSSHTNYDGCLMDDEDDYLFTTTLHTDYGDECLMDGVDVDDTLPSHESRPTRHTQPHPSAYSRPVELSDSQVPPPFESPMPSGVSPDIIAQLTFTELSHNPEFMKVYTGLDALRSTLSKLAAERTEAEHSRLDQARERVLEWRMRVPDA